MTILDYKFYTQVNKVIADVIQEAKEIYGSDVNLDLLVVQDDKYRNTQYETIIYGIGSTSNMRENEKYTNALEQENTRESRLAEQYYNEPVSYYEHVGDLHGYISYRVMVYPATETIKVVEVSYGEKYGTLEPFYTTLYTIDKGVKV